MKNDSNYSTKFFLFLDYDLKPKGIYTFFSFELPIKHLIFLQNFNFTLIVLRIIFLFLSHETSQNRVRDELLFGGEEGGESFGG
jgi:hypothetical protein